MLAVSLSIFPGSTGALAADTAEQLQAAAALFKRGKFPEAREAYARVLAAEPNDYDALVAVGNLDLLGNHLDDAQASLSKAIEINPHAPAPKSLLAEVFYRRDDFAHAAALYRAIGNDLRARQLESFRGQIPYQIQSGADSVTLKFVHTDPNPVVSVKVNGHGPVNFLIDTGTGEVILDPEFASEVGASRFGSASGTQARGRQTARMLGRIDTLALGDMTLHNVPVQFLATGEYWKIDGLPIDGIIGTVLLYHFLSTLDLRGGELVLRQKTKADAGDIERGIHDGAVVLPFWMAGDHIMVAWGAVNHVPELMVVDTGCDGCGFVGPESTIRDAHLKLIESEAQQGPVSGGTVIAKPMLVDELSLGDAIGGNITGIFGAFPPALENGFGFRIGGLISHTFFRRYAMTFDFTSMRLIMTGDPESAKPAAQ
ncbi:MAG: aspartyl protease family protein [Candidatus Binataceae bacterium]